MMNNDTLTTIHLSGNFPAVVNNLNLFNNTVVETVYSSGMQDYEVISFNGDPSPSTMILKNNILYIGRYFHAIAHKTTFSHDHNLYYVSAGTSIGFDLGTGEMEADPLFNDIQNSHVYLTATSPAIDAGVDLGYTVDYYGTSVPQGDAPDMGANEYQY